MKTRYSKSALITHLKLDSELFSKAEAKIDKKIIEAVWRIKDAPKLKEFYNGNVNKVYVGHSGGKDSVLVRYLADLAFGYGNVPTVHTTKPAHVENAVHPLTRDFLYKQSRAIIYVGLDEQASLGLRLQIDGTRIAEHDRDDGRSVDVVVEGKSVSRKELKLYMQNGLLGLDFIFPIYDWSNEEVWAAIISQGIPFSEEYLVGM